MSYTWKLDTKELDKLASVLDKNREEVLFAAGFMCQQGSAMRAPYETGALSTSIITKTKNTNNYSGGASGAAARNPDAEILEFPDVDEYTVIVGPVVNYGEYVELGTSHMAPKPYLFPAVDEVVNAINSGKFWERLFKR